MFEICERNVFRQIFVRVYNDKNRVTTQTH